MKFLMGKLFKFFILVVLLALSWFFYFIMYANFHQVDQNTYRSAQLNRFNMPFYIKKYKIKSILNLRGKSLEKWYSDEMQYSKEHHLVHYDYGIGDRKKISIEQMKTLVHIMKNAPKPLLIHCKIGADRTSLVSALYLYAIKKDKNADRAISIVYGHFPWLGSETYYMDDSFDSYKKQFPIK
jgi:protein tyrosine/serine phosphatase